MNVKVLQVFYGHDTLPYKDKERSVHFPIVGQSFLGAANTTEIRFYFEQLGDIHARSTYVVSAKLPNGKIGYKLLTKQYDNEAQEWYAKLLLDSFFTQAKGDLYLSLRGYEGEVTLELNDNDDYVIKGTPTIQGTGSIKLTIAYAVPYQQGSEDEEVTLEQIYAEIGTKLNIISDEYYKVCNDISDTEENDWTQYPVGTVIYDKTTKKTYKRIETSPYYELYPFSNFYVDIDNTTTLEDLVSKGHFFVVRYYGGSNQALDEFLFYGKKWSTGFYQFSFIGLTSGYKRWGSNFDQTPTAIDGSTTVASIIANDSQYRQDLQVDNLVAISSGGTSTTYYDQKLEAQINKPNCIINYDGDYYYPYSKSGTTITFVCPRIRSNTSQNAFGKTITQLEVRYLEAHNSGTNPYITKNAWYFDSYYSANVINSSLGSTFDFTIDSDYKVTFTLKSLNGTVLKTDTIDLPLESVIVDGYYDDTTETLYLVLDNGTKISIPVHDLVEGLVNEDDLVANYYSKTQIDTELAKKVDKTSTASQVYTTNASGNQ